VLEEYVDVSVTNWQEGEETCAMRTFIKYFWDGQVKEDEKARKYRTYEGDVKCVHFGQQD
jgi:hypothetical protein